jgi:hypothetical protein
MITNWITDGEEPNTLYAMIEEDKKRLKFFYPNVFSVELAMNAKAKDLIEGIGKTRDKLSESPRTTKQRLVKIKIESVEYVEKNNTTKG